NASAGRDGRPGRPRLRAVLGALRTGVREGLAGAFIAEIRAIAPFSRSTRCGRARRSAAETAQPYAVAGAGREVRHPPRPSHSPHSSGCAGRERESVSSRRDTNALGVVGHEPRIGGPGSSRPQEARMNLAASTRESGTGAALGAVSIDLLRLWLLAKHVCWSSAGAGFGSAHAMFDEFASSYLEAAERVGERLRA